MEKKDKIKLGIEILAGTKSYENNVKLETGMAIVLKKNQIFDSENGEIKKWITYEEGLLIDQALFIANIALDMIDKLNSK